MPQSSSRASVPSPNLPFPPTLPNFNALIPDHLDILEGLPNNLRYLYSKITHIQHQLDESLDAIHEATTGITTSMHDRIVTKKYRSKDKWEVQLAANQALSHVAGGPILRVQRLAQEKVDLATYAYELVDKCVLKLDHELKSAGLPIQDAYPVILAAVTNLVNSMSNESPDINPNPSELINTIDTPFPSPETNPIGETTNSSDADATTIASALSIIPEEPAINSSRKRDRTADMFNADTETNHLDSHKSNDRFSTIMESVEEINTNKTTTRASRPTSRRGSTDILLTTASLIKEPTTSTPSLSEFTTPIDPNEPLYCTCQSVAHGEMIACDDTDCPYEWFHYACVGLKKAPKGTWYCTECYMKRKRARR